MAQVARIDPATRFVRRLDGDFLKLQEAADLLGVSKRTLRNFIRKKREGFQPSHIGYMGKLGIYLYSEEDVERIRQLLDDRYKIRTNEGQGPMGRPAVYTTEERVIRQRQYSMAHYYRKRYESLVAEGKAEKAEAARVKMEEYENLLKEAKK